MRSKNAGEVRLGVRKKKKKMVGWRKKKANVGGRE